MRRGCGSDAVHEHAEDAVDVAYVAYEGNEEGGTEFPGGHWVWTLVVAGHRGLGLGDTRVEIDCLVANMFSSLDTFIRSRETSGPEKSVGVLEH